MVHGDKGDICVGIVRIDPHDCNAHFMGCKSLLALDMLPILAETGNV